MFASWVVRDQIEPPLRLFGTVQSNGFVLQLGSREGETSGADYYLNTKLEYLIWICLLPSTPMRVFVWK